MKNLKIALAIIILSSCFYNCSIHNIILAASPYSQTIQLNVGWNIISTPRILSSHSFSADQISSNFDIYILDPHYPSKWATMADLGQTEFQPLYGYFINNKTDDTQTLTLNYFDDVSPAQRLFERNFDKAGWYSIGVANPTYAQKTCLIRDKKNNASILASLDSHYDNIIDLTSGSYDNINPTSTFVGNDWAAATGSDLNSIHDLMETKGYAIYLNSDEAAYTGFQNIGDPNCPVIPPATLTLAANSSSPKVGIINAVNTTDALTDKTVFVFDVLSAGTDSTIKTLVLDSVEGTLGEITSGSLYDGSNVIASAAVVDANSDKTGTITFSNLNIALLKDTTKTLTVKINVKPVDGTGAVVADSITIGFNSLVAVDSNYNAPTSPAAVAGTAQKLYVKAPVFTFESADTQTKTVNPSTGAETVNGSLHFSVTAQGQDVYITDTVVHATQGVILAQQVANGTPATTVYTFTQMNLTSADADYAAGVYKVAAGTTKHFAAAYTISVATANGYNGAQLDHALWSTNADGVTGAVDFGFMLTTAKSGQIGINK